MMQMSATGREQGSAAAGVRAMQARFPECWMTDGSWPERVEIVVGLPRMASRGIRKFKPKDIAETLVIKTLVVGG